MMKVIYRVRPTAAVCALLIGAAGGAAAQDATRWDGDVRSAARLIAGARASGDASAPLRAGIEIRLAAGWHTYWRYPGDAGVPPQFDFAGSQNVKSVDVLWPAPKRLPEAGMVVIGYDRDIVLPLAIVPQNPGKPVTLRLKLDYAVCEKLCVPAQAKAELAIGTGPSAHDAALSAAAARVPKQTALGGGQAFSIRSVTREDGTPRPRILVDVVAPAGAPLDLFAEGPTSHWSLPVPAPVEGAPAGLQRFAFELDGAPPGETYQGIAITLTAVAGPEAIEVSKRLE